MKSPECVVEVNGSGGQPPLYANSVSSKITDTTEKSKMWAVQGDCYSPCEVAVDQLPPGQYIVRESMNGLYFVKKDVNLDDILVLPDNASKKVVDGIEKFWGKEEIYRQFGFLWKRGVLLYGPPGSGKTSTVQQLSSKIVEKGGITLYVTDPRLDSEGLRVMRKLEPSRPVVVILEDIDTIIQNYGESHVLAMLDGELQIDNVVFVATTNYPEKLDGRITNRPSRFDEVIRIGMPSEECRKEFFKLKNPRLASCTEELNLWVKQTKGYSIAHMKEVIVSVECLDNTFEETIIRIEKLRDSKLSSDQDNDRSFGFAIDKNVKS